MSAAVIVLSVASSAAKGINIPALHTSTFFFLCSLVLVLAGNQLKLKQLLGRKAKSAPLYTKQDRIMRVSLKLASGFLSHSLQI